MSTQTTTQTASYRKTKTGEWVAYGPTSIVRIGQVAVAQKDGEVKVETIERVGRTFQVNGVDMVYGYLFGSSAYHATAAADRRDPWSDVSTPRGVRPAYRRRHTCPRGFCPTCHDED